MWECDDIEHINSAYADSGFFVTEVTNEESKYDYSESETHFRTSMCLYGREAYSMSNYLKMKTSKTMITMFLL